MAAKAVPGMVRVQERKRASVTAGPSVLFCYAKLFIATGWLWVAVVDQQVYSRTRVYLTLTRVEYSRYFVWSERWQSRVLEENSIHPSISIHGQGGVNKLRARLGTTPHSRSHTIYDRFVKLHAKSIPYGRMRRRQ